ncbi:MAG: hypothetical protein OEV44_11865 [Spirochaetota bacterium]|nr:hypothetical protein [Spirochaetota bacterium]
MNRRDFIKNTSKIATAGLITTGLTGCIKGLDELLGSDHISLRNGKTWTNLQQVIPLNASGLTWDSSYCNAPSVIKDGSVYKMWYEASNGLNTRILYCESVNGINWSNFNLAINTGASGTGFDNSHTGAPCVIKDNGVYKMWYQGSDGTNWRIIYCESGNGINWSNFQLAINIASSGLGFDSNDVINPCVIKDGSIYKMWYAGWNLSNWRILNCESSNGVNWSNYKLSVNIASSGLGYDSSNVASPCVIKDGSVYKMWYDGSNGTWRILYCESSDGVTWTNYQLSVNTSSSGTGLDTVGVAGVSVINESGIGKMWYVGFDATNIQILYGESW